MTIKSMRVDDGPEMQLSALWSPRAKRGAKVIMLLDNHYAPDRRVEYECGLLGQSEIDVLIMAWDRRVSSGGQPEKGSEESSTTPNESTTIVRIAAPAPPGGGLHSFRVMLTYARRVWRMRQQLSADGDVIVVHDVYLLPLAYALHLKTRLPFIYDAHEDYAVMEAQRFPGWWLRGVARIESCLARRAEAIIVPGRTRRHRWTGFKQVVILRNFGAGEGTTNGPSRETKWDLAYVGSLVPERRLDLLLEVGRRRPELRIMIAGGGRATGEIENAARDLPNVEFLGWCDKPDALLAQARAVFYGLDPAHPYSSHACPNTLFQALRVRRPLIFLCGGEPAEVLAEYRIGIRCAPTAESIMDAFDETGGREDWQFAEALNLLASEGDTCRYIEIVAKAAEKGRRQKSTKC